MTDKQRMVLSISLLSMSCLALPASRFVLDVRGFAVNNTFDFYILINMF